MSNEDFDPFGQGDKTPAISFKDAAIGTVRTLNVTEYASSAQSREFESGDPAFWPDGNKKMSAVLKGTDENGEATALWAAIPSAMLTAVREAQEAVSKGYRLKPGDKLTVQFYAEKPNEKNPRLNAQKLYRAKIEVGTAPPPAAADPWASEPAAASASTVEPPF